MLSVKGICKVHNIICHDGSHVQVFSHAKSIKPIFESWYTDTWSIVSFHQDIFCIKLVNGQN